MGALKENEKFPEAMEVCHLNDREFKTAVMKKLSWVIREVRLFSDLKNKNNEHKEYFTKKIKTIKKDQREKSGDEELDCLREN